MGDLLKEIKTERLRTGGLRSGVDKILEALPEQERADLLKALRDPRISQTAIANVLTRHGHKVAGPVIGAWRRRNGIS